MSVEIECAFIRESENAVLIRPTAIDEDVWIPFSQVESMHGKRADGRGSGCIVITDWIAKQKGLA